MAFPVTKIQLTDKLSEIRNKYNEMIDAFVNISFEDGDLFYTGSINQTEEKILLNQSETQNGSIGKYPGIEIDRGTATNVILVWDETDDKWKIGTVGSLTALSLEGHLHDDDYYRKDENIILNDNKIINGIGEDGIAIDTGTLIVDENINAKNLQLQDSTNPTKIEFYNTYTNETNYERGFFKFESDIMKIGVEHMNGNIREMGIVQTGLMKFFSYQNIVNDDVSFTLPVISNSAFGWISIGNNLQYSMFMIAPDGTVSLISNSVDVVTNSDVDLKLCIGTSVASPVVIKNRLGGNYNVNLVMFYN